MTDVRVPYWRSLRFRLPAVISVLVASVFAFFLWTLNGALEKTLIDAGGERAGNAASQVADMLAQSTNRASTQLTRLAGDAAVAAYVRDPRQPDVAIRGALIPLAAAGQPPVEVWSADGRRLLEVASPRSAAPAPARAAAASWQPGLSPFRAEGDKVSYDVVAAIGDAQQPSGYVVLRRTLTEGQGIETINRLVGDHAAVRIGNRDGSVWTDLAKPIGALPIDASQTGVQQHVTGGDARVGSARLVAGTPWAVWVDFPRADTVSSARAVIYRMTGVGAVFLVAAAGLVALVSRRITRPLHDLTDAAAAVSRRDFSKRVDVWRRDEIGRLGQAFNDMANEIGDAQRTLEARVDERTAGLRRVNEELEAFSYSVSHDLRAPLRHVAGFATLLSQSGSNLDDTQRRYVSTIVDAARRMGTLIDDLLAFSRISRTPLVKAPVDLSQLADEARHEVMTAAKSAVTWDIQSLPRVRGDRALLRLALVNLFSNALKYSSTRDLPRITVSGAIDGREAIVHVRDNGVGFDMQYAGKLFGVFQRLHKAEEFEGTGIGLANVRRIIERHGGRIWAHGALGEGATFSLALPLETEEGDPADAG